jgi:AAA domain
MSQQDGLKPDEHQMTLAEMQAKEPGARNPKDSPHPNLLRMAGPPPSVPSLEDDPDYQAAVATSAESKAAKDRNMASLLGLPDDFPPEIVARAADDEGFAKELSRQVNARLVKAALIEYDERKFNRKPLDIATLSELRARPANTWRIKSRENVAVPGTGDGLIQADSNTLIVGPAKAGKTTLLGNLTHSLITNEPFLGRYDEVRPVQGSIIILNYEVSGPTYERWLTDMRVPDEHLHIISLRGVANPFESERGKAELIEALQVRGCEVLIVDPFTRAFTGNNQNDASQVQNWTRSLDEVTKAAGVQDTIVAHHTGWEGERARGSSELVGWPDAIINLTRVGDDRYLSAEGRDVQMAEAQLLWFAETRHLRLAPGNRAQVKATKKFGGLTDAVVEVVTASPGVKVKEIGDALRANGVPMQRGDDSKACQQAV